MVQAIGWNLEAEKVLWRAICAPNRWHLDDGETVGTHPHSYRYFLEYGWGAKLFLARHPEEPQWYYEPIHYRFCDWMQKHLLRWKEHAKTGLPERYHIAAVLPRGFGKTVSATKSGSLWTHLDEPDMTTLFNSGTAPLAQDVLGAIASVISGRNRNSWFTWLYGNWKAGAGEWDKLSLKHGYRTSDDVSEPSFDTTGAAAGMTGYHHRQHWWDDPIIKNKLRDDRVAYMKSVHDAVNASFNACHTNGLMAFILTRYYDDDVAGRHFKEKGIATWEGMECPHVSHCTEKVEWGQGIWHVFFYQTEDELTGEVTHPKLWTKRMIADAKRIDPEDFACQQQNNPGSGDRAPIVESQIPHLYVSYNDFSYLVPVKWATIHIDTAFKTPDTVRSGDDNAIVVWLADARENGVLYLDTSLLYASNEDREEQFNERLVKTCLNLRRRGYWIRAITDEQEPGGKVGTYKNRILAVLSGAGIELGANNFIQLPRRINKKARIRTGAGNWAEGYVRILLNRRDDGTWEVPLVVRKMVNQILHIDRPGHDDLADAQTDGFIPALWTRPTTNPGLSADEGGVAPRPWDEELKGFGKPLSTEMLLALIDEQKEMREAGLDDGVRGRDYLDPDDDAGWVSRMVGVNRDRLGL